MGPIEGDMVFIKGVGSSVVIVIDDPIVSKLTEEERQEIAQIYLDAIKKRLETPGLKVIVPQARFSGSSGEESFCDRGEK